MASGHSLLESFKRIQIDPSANMEVVTNLGLEHAVVYAPSLSRIP
jgi:hypothetical protein